MLDGSLPVTLQYQLKNKLIERIGHGEWQPGSKISSEREICEEYGVSRITVREVIGDLEREGYLSRKQGKGTFVNQLKTENNTQKLYRFSEEIKRAGCNTTTRVLAYEIIPCGAAEAEHLGITKGERVYFIERLRFIDGTLFSLERSYIPVSVAPGMTEDAVKQQGLYNAIQQHSNLADDEVEESFAAIPCPDKPAMMIGVKRDAAVLQVSRLTKSEGKSLEYCESLIRGDRYKYKIVLR